MPSVQGDDSSGLGFGVEGTSNAGTGVVGRSKNGIGTVGESSTGNGVLGQSDTGDGVAGSSGQGNGVSGQSKEANGVLGSTNAVTGSGVFGSNKSEGNGVTGLSEFGFGVYGLANQQNPDRLVAGVIGECKRSGWGVLGLSPEGRAAVAGLSDKGDGVLGQTSTEESAGVHGVNFSNPATIMGGDGVRGEGNVGVHGIATTSNELGAGVHGENSLQDGVGVRGVAPNGIGVVGKSDTSVGVAGLSGGAFLVDKTAGVFGSSATGPGVSGFGLNSNVGVFAFGSPTALGTLGGLFVGGSGGFTGDLGVVGKGTFATDVQIIGTLTAANKQFQIDHPLDPAKKYLNHASVESSEMKTIYDGIVVLDDQGQAVVELPAWFESLNIGFRYQLTPIGAPALNLHIAEEISDNRFKIAGGQAGLKVCWQVTGVRQDSFARAQPLVVELDKPAKEQGYFLHPEYHNQPKERGIAWAREPDLMRRVEQIQVSFEDKNKAGEK